MKKIILVLFVMVSAMSLKAQKVHEYTASNGVTYKVNQTIVLAVPADGDRFTSIMDLLAASAGADSRASGTFAGSEVPIKKIKLRKVFGTKRAFISIGKGYVIDLEAAIKLKEIEL